MTLQSVSSGETTTFGSNGDLEKQSVEDDSKRSRTWIRSCLRSIVCGIHTAKSTVFERFTSQEKTIEVPIVRSLSKFLDGYPNLAAFQDSSENFMIYRRFGYLHSRVLLKKQDELRLLEGELDQFDEDNEGCAVTNQPNDMTRETIEQRNELLGRIESALTNYASSLSIAQQLVAFNKPTSQEQKSVSTYLENQKPVKEEEREYVKHAEDLVTLRPGREHAWLDRSIERTLQGFQKPLPFLHRMFCSKQTSLKVGDPTEFGDVYYYTRERIERCAVGIITIVILALLVVPIWFMYHLVTTSGDVLTGRENAICIGTMLISTLLFSAVLSLFTRAKRHEILAAAAAYCAVLVVFLGNVHPA